MKTILKPVVTAGMILALGFAPAAFAAPKAGPAPAASAPAAQTIAIADLDAVAGNSDANRVAAQQRQVTYKAQIDQYKTRSQQLQAQIQPMIEKFNKDRAAPGASQASLQQQAEAIQRLQEQGKAELQQIIKPVVYSEAYVNEQIEDKLNDAVKNAMNKHGVTVLLSAQAVLATQNAFNLNQAILAELNTLIPTAQLVPPAGWEPRQIREQQQQAQAAQQAQQAPAARPAGPQPDGR